MLAVLIVASMNVFSGLSGSIAPPAVTSLKWPRMVIMPRCLAENSTCVCIGSNFQVPITCLLGYGYGSQGTIIGLLFASSCSNERAALHYLSGPQAKRPRAGMRRAPHPGLRFTGEALVGLDSGAAAPGSGALCRAGTNNSRHQRADTI